MTFGHVSAFDETGSGTEQRQRSDSGEKQFDLTASVQRCLFVGMLATLWDRVSAAHPCRVDHIPQHGRTRSKALLDKTS